LSQSVLLLGEYRQYQANYRSQKIVCFLRSGGKTYSFFEELASFIESHRPHERTLRSRVGIIDDAFDCGR
jgi:hypothetical protein